MSSVKWRQFGIGLNELNDDAMVYAHNKQLIPDRD